MAIFHAFSDELEVFFVEVGYDLWRALEGRADDEGFSLSVEKGTCLAAGETADGDDHPEVILRKVLENEDGGEGFGTGYFGSCV